MVRWSSRVYVEKLDSYFIIDILCNYGKIYIRIKIRNWRLILSNFHKLKFCFGKNKTISKSGMFGNRTHRSDRIRILRVTWCGYWLEQYILWFIVLLFLDMVQKYILIIFNKMWKLSKHIYSFWSNVLATSNVKLSPYHGLILIFHNFIFNFSFCFA